MSFLNKKLLLFIYFFGWVLFNSCKNPDEDPVPVAPTPIGHSKIYDIMKEWYLWNDQIPEVKLSDYKTPMDLLNALRYQDIDRWSYIEDEETFDQYFEEGKFYGYGFGMKLDAEDNLRVSFVYTNAPMDRVGVTRGYKILKINGKPVSELLATNSLNSAWGENKPGVVTNIEVEDLNGAVREEQISKEEVVINSVVHQEIKEVGGDKVGYLVFNNFIGTSNEELDEAFENFKQAGITELVLDLRYNGGGSLSVAQHLANLIGSSKAGTGKFVELAYNDLKKQSNAPYNFKAEANAIDINRLIVITSRSTASASEAIINGLRPYMEVITVGDYTGGKPVGMNVWKVEGMALVPITFKVLNANGEAEYFEGIMPDGVSADGLFADFGDVNEDCLKQSLYFIQNGTFSGEIARLKREVPEKQIILEGFRAEVGAF